MKTDFYLEPESEAEIELVDLLAEAREVGLEKAGLSPQEVSIVFQQFAIGALHEPEQVSEPQATCPVCGTEIDSVETTGIGSQPIVQPCGCETTYDQLPEDLFLSDGDT